jgi:two-component system, OmpR family, sensor histidine kinase TctE
VFKLSKFLPENSLSQLLFAWLMLFILPVIFISALVAYYLSNQYANLAYDRALYRKALALSDQVNIVDNKVSVDLPQIARDLIEFDEDDDIYFRIIGPQGDLIKTSSQLPIPLHYPQPDQHTFYTSKIDGEALKVVVYHVPIESSSTRLVTPNIYVLVGETLQKRHLMTNEIILGMIVPQLIIVGLISLLLFYGIKRGLKPLSKIQTELKLRDVNDLSPLESELAPLEIKPLLDAFNGLLIKAKHNISMQQRFISDASHQLKTPLAGVKTQAELALREHDPEKIQHALAQINHASTNLSHLVQQLLNLTKAEPDGSAFLNKENINLATLAQELSTEYVTTALKKDLDLEFSSQAQSSLVFGNTMLIKELMRNLIDNAIRYTPSGGKVIIGVKSTDNSVDFYVQDNGIGISSKHQMQIFNRFYRVLGTNEEGCGLGLTIVKEIAERHQAQVYLNSEGENQGALFTVSFPKV